MRRILSIMIMCLLLAGCGKADTPAQTTAPATPAETVAVTTAPATEGPEGILEEKQTETVYLLTRTTVYSGEAQEDWHRECTYDAAGRLVEEFDYVAGHTLSARCSYTYDEGGLLAVLKAEHISHEDPEKVEMTLTTQYTYDDQGRKILTQVYENGELSTEESCVYDDNGNLIETVTCPGGIEEIRYITRSTYDESGRLVETVDIFEEEVLYRTTYSYSQEGELTGSKDYDMNDNCTGSMEITWEGSTKTVTYWDMTGEVYLTDVTTYNASGEPTLSESVYADGEVITTEYIYEPYEIQK